MISPQKPGLAMILVGIILVAGGTVMYLLERPRGSQNSFCDGSYCIVKSPIYCYKTLHGILFDSGCPIILAGSIILLFSRRRKSGQVTQKIENTDFRESHKFFIVVLTSLGSVLCYCVHV